ncbi:MAG: helix-turn-helix domain-containing protein [Actinocatenispora sp.]
MSWWGVAVLTVLGVDAPEERVYQTLVRHSAATLDELATELHLDRADLSRSLERLEARGLAGRSGSGHDRFVAASPTIAIGALLNQHRAQLHQVELTLATLAEQYREAVGGRSVDNLVEVVSGAQATRHRLDQLRAAARQEVLAFVLPAAPDTGWTCGPLPGGTEDPGVAHRMVWGSDLLEERDAMTALPPGHSVRIVRRVPMPMLIVDRSAALVPLDGGPGAVIVHPSGVLDALLVLFDTVWSVGLPLPGGRESHIGAAVPDGVEEMDARILSLLLVGLTDRSVAVQLGLSMRTVQRRVRHLMDLADVQTRLQLGWYAARNGWL